MSAPCAACGDSGLSRIEGVSVVEVRPCRHCDSFTTKYAALASRTPLSSPSSVGATSSVTPTDTPNAE